MLGHVRRQIRDRAVTQLTGLPTTGSRIYAGSPYAIDRDKLPALAVDVTGESAAPDFMSFGIEARVAEITVTAYAEGEDGEDQLDRIAGEIEAALLADPQMGGVAVNCEFLRTVWASSADAAMRSFEMRMTFAATYRYRTGYPGAAA